MSHKNFDMTSEEARRIADAMKDPEFRKLLQEYADEISNPENLRKREEELAMLEAESNGSVELILPRPGFCFKTKGSKGKTFVNIAVNEKVEPAKSTTARKGPNGEAGKSWSIPYSLAHPRSDKDTAGELCQVYDFVVSPATIEMIDKDIRFRGLLVDTAFEAIEKGFQDKLDKDVVFMRQMKYKGVPVSAVFRRNPSKDSPLSQMEKALGKPPQDDYADEYSSSSHAPSEQTSKAKFDKSTKPATSTQSGPIEPKFSITHRGEIDLQHYTNTRYQQAPSRPKELIISIQLPSLTSSQGVDVEVEGRRLYLEKKPEYRLETLLPFEVNSDEGSAKFDKTKRTLILTLPVLPAKEMSPEVPDGPVVEYMHLDRHGGLVSHEQYIDESEPSTTIEGDSCIQRQDVDATSHTGNEEVSIGAIPAIDDEPTGFESDPENDLQYIPSTIDDFSTKQDEVQRGAAGESTSEEGHRLDVDPSLSMRGFIPECVEDDLKEEDLSSEVSEQSPNDVPVDVGLSQQIQGLGLRSVSGETIRFASSAAFELEED